MECASEAVCQRRDKEICYLGWILLFLWLVMVIYITKEIWFGAPLSTPTTSINSLNKKPENSAVIEMEIIET
ncbi:unnamed protein product [Caenorhabditis angaria]|uniref:Uncharacterized protein n=1 Tax=Caenorhabditis angaria TaxID=860376 RepID=A0A9P1IKF3_9PELO|nr:unnamed protein product [Caenorhabditis angaria]